MIHNCSLGTITIAILAAAFLGGCGKPESEQLNNDLKQARAAVNSRGGGFVAFMAGAVSIKEDISEIVTDSFTCTPLYPLKKGDQLAARMSGEEAWSIDTCSVQAGTRKVSLPMLAMVKSHAVIPATFKTKNDIAAGGTVHSSGYTIVAIRAVKEGEPIAVLDVGDGMFAVETSKGPSNEADEMPSIAVFKNGLKPQDRVSALEAWLTVKSAGD